MNQDQSPYGCAVIILLAIVTWICMIFIAAASVALFIHVLERLQG